MGISFAYIVAWILPALAGSGVWFALRGVARRGDVATSIGAGWLIGVFIAAEIARFVAASATQLAFERTWLWLLLIGIVAWIVAFVRGRSASVIRWTDEPRVAIALRITWWILVAWIAFRLYTLASEAALRPVFPWDAWSAWSVKPKTWFLMNRYEPYVSMADWLAHPDETLRTMSAWRYPELLAWVQIWFASAAGAWNEPLVDLAWCGALGAFALAAFGTARALGLSSWAAIAVAYAVVSLPLIDAHVALAGYADLWIAMTLGLVSLAWVRWLATRDAGQGVLAVGLALALPAIKLEGFVWLLAFATFATFDLVPRRRRGLALTVLALLIVGAIVAAVVLTMHIGGASADVPAIGTFGIAWHGGVGGALVASLFTLPNWHLLWYLVPVVLVLRRHRFGADRGASMLGLMLLADFAFLAFLFFFTGASAWAQDFTSANRLILQLVPSLVVLGAVLFRPLRGDASGFSAASMRRDRASALPIVRA